jgi:hypothetical protein
MHMPNNSELSYPVREYIHVPTSPAEWIDEELRTGGHGRQLRESLIIGLNAIYGNSPLVKSFKSYANAIATARKYSSSVQENFAEERIPLRAQAFNAGALLATHSTVQMLDTAVRQRILMQEYVDENDVQDLFEETKRGRQFAATVLNAADTYGDLFESQPMELQDAIMTAAGQTFGDLPATPRTEYENEFMFGYVFSANAIRVKYEEISKDADSPNDEGNFALP